MVTGLARRIARHWRATARALAVTLAVLVGPAAVADAAPCRTNCLAPGDYTITTLSGGLPRTYLVHVPASYTGDTAVPLLLDIHGFSSYAADQRKYSGQLQESDRRGFIAVWPDGVGLSWNGYGCCAVADATGIDDVGFLRGIIVAMQGRANIAADRVYVTGISNGGSMAHRMACEAADLVRAVASVAYPLNSAGCRPARPVTVTQFHGTADGTISYCDKPAPIPGLPATIAGVPLGVQGARESLAAWKVINGCTADLTRTQLNDQVRSEAYRSCNDGVGTELVTVADGKHVLYGGYVGLGYDGTYFPPINVADYMWTNVFKP